MAKNDKYFQNVKDALFKDGWITSSPLHLRSEGISFQIDIAAERVILIAESKQKEQIAVEVKSFLDKSFINDYHRAVGQYTNYVHILKEVKSPRKLWLAVEENEYRENFTNPLIIRLTIANNMSIVTFNATTNRIVQWIP